MLLPTDIGGSKSQSIDNAQTTRPEVYNGRKNATDLLTRDKKERLKLCTTQSTGILTKKKKNERN